MNLRLSSQAVQHVSVFTFVLILLTDVCMLKLKTKVYLVAHLNV